MALNFGKEENDGQSREKRMDNLNENRDLDLKGKKRIGLCSLFPTFMATALEKVQKGLPPPYLSEDSKQYSIVVINRT